MSSEHCSLPLLAWHNEPSLAWHIRTYTWLNVNM